MNRANHAVAKSIFLNLIELESELERSVCLHERCRGDELLRHDVLELLRNDSEEGSFFVDQFLDVAATTDRAIQDSLSAQIGPYKLLEQIGEGGMGVVYLAQQSTPIRRLVALKIIKPGMDSRQVVARFEAERQALAMMNHPHIAKVLDAGTTSAGSPYFVMELVRGVCITEFCNSRKLDLRQRLALFSQVCDAVQHAHQKGIIHRDLKPSNILVEVDDVRPIPKVIDFGVAKATQQALTDATLYTGIAHMVGTPLYMSPEQAQMQSQDVDTRSDVYSLGVVLYELLTGNTPFHREALKEAGFDEMRRIICKVEPPKPSARVSTLGAVELSTVSDQRHIDPRKLSPLIRGELDWIVLKALEKDRSRRYQTASALASDIERYLAGTAVQACPPTVWYRGRKLASQYRTALLASAAVVIAMIAGTTTSILLAVRAVHAEQIAEQGLEDEKVARQAEVAARLAEAAARRQTEQASALAYRQQYRAEIQLGQRDLEAGNLSRLFASLAKHLPEPGREDLRGWEWGHLLSGCRPGRELCRHSLNVSSIAWSPDGLYLASTSSDGSAVVWDVGTGQPLRRFEAGSTLKRGVAWSPDGRRLAWGSVSNENALRIWDRQNDEVTTLRGHTFSLISCNWSPDGSRVATTAMDQTVRIWDVAGGACLHVLTDPDKPLSNERNQHHINGVCWTADGENLITAGELGAKVWDATSGELLKRIGSDHYTTAAISTADQPLLVLGRRAIGECILIDVGSWEVRQVVRGHKGRVTHVAFSPSGDQFASAGSDATVRIYNVDDGRKLLEIQSLSTSVTSLAWNPNGKQIAVADADGAIVLADLPISKQLHTIPSVDEPIVQMHWSDSDKALQIDGMTKKCFCNLATDSIEQVTAHAREDKPVISPDGRLQALAVFDDARINLSVSVSEVVSGLPICHFTRPWSTNLNLDWSPDSQRVALHDGRGVSVWSVPEGREVFDWKGVVSAHQAWSPDGRRLAITGGGDRAENGYLAYMPHLHVWDADSGTRLAKIRYGMNRETGTVVDWNSTGDFLAAGNGSGEVAIIDARSFRQVSKGRLHVGAVEDLDWSPDSRRVVSVSVDGSLKVWDPSSGDEYVTLNFDVQLSAVAWSSDGERLAAGDRTGQVTIWDPASVSTVRMPDAQRQLVAKMHHIRAAEFAAEDDLDKAIGEATQAIELAPRRTDYLLARAELYAYKQQWSDALEDVTNVLSLQPDDIRALRFRTELYATAERWKEALADAARIGELRETNRSRFPEVVIQLKLGNLEAAREFRREEVIHRSGLGEEYLPTDLWTCTLVPVDASELAKLGPAMIEIAKRLVATTDGSWTDHLTAGAMAYRAGRNEEALELLNMADRQVEAGGDSILGSVDKQIPTSANNSLPGYLWYFLALTHYDLGQFAEARTWFDKAEEYSRPVLAKPATFQPVNDVNWYQHVVLEALQHEARQKLGGPAP